MTAWLTHAEYEQLDPGAAEYAQQMERKRKLQQGDRYQPRREFPCSGTFRAHGAPSAAARLFVCDECGEEMGVPLALLDDAAAVSWMIERSGLPQRHVGTVIEKTDDNSSARSALRAWIESHATGQIEKPPLLVGEVGRGKTQLLTAAAVSVMRRTHQPVRYWSLADLLDAERQTFKTHDPSPVAAAKLARVLVLDDLGAERETDFAVDTLGQIIDARYREGRPTLGATNIMPSDWPDTFGDRTASRLLEATAPVLVQGHDRRNA